MPSKSVKLDYQFPSLCNGVVTCLRNYFCTSSEYQERIEGVGRVFMCGGKNTDALYDFYDLFHTVREMEF